MYLVVIPLYTLAIIAIVIGESPHDRSPVDNGTFTQKPAALKALDKMPNRKKLFLTRMAMQELTHG